VEDGRLAIEVRAARADEPPAIRAPTSSNLPVSAVSDLRRRAQALRRSPAAMAVQNELFTLDRLIAKKQAHPGRRYVDPAQRERLKRLRGIAEGLERLGSEATALEDALLLHLYEDAPLPDGIARVGERVRKLADESDELLLHLFTLEQPDPHSVTMAIYGSAAGDLFALARAYRDAARATADDAAVGVSYYTRLGKHQVQRTTVDANETEAFLANPRGVLGLLLAIRAPFARARFETESGLHVIEEERNKNPHPFLVDTSALAPAEYRPPKDVEFRVALAGQRRRTYTLDRLEAQDAVANKAYRWPPRAMWRAVAQAMDDHLRERTQGVIAD
jgi:hypothetical protein